MKNKGITLVALIITIIILLILAGITIGQLTENGIFENAKTAKEKYENAQDLENQILEGYESELNKYVTAIRDEEGKDLYGIAATTGDGTEANPYMIDTADQLLAFSQLVNGGRSFEGKFFKLSQDIDLSSVCHRVDGTKENDISWTPISKNFKGTFDGNNKKIKNIYINSSEDGQALFGTMDGATVKNIYLTGSISGVYYVGGIAGYIDSGTIENCINNATIKGQFSVGGIAGQCCNIRISNCLNINTVTQERIDSNQSNVGNAGGILGLCCIGSTNIDNCYNIGQVSGTASVGGILGYETEYLSNFGDHTVSITNSYNKENASGASNIGPIIGQKDNGMILSITNSYYVSGQTKSNTYSGEDNSVEKTDDELKNLASSLGELWQNDELVDENDSSRGYKYNNGYPILKSHKQMLSEN